MEQVNPDHRGNGTEALEREPFGGLNEVEIEELVERVSKKVMARFYQNVGQSVVSKALWVIGLATVALAVWLAGTGKMKIFQ